MREVIIWGTGKKANDFSDQIMLWNNLSQKLGQGKIFAIKYYLDSDEKKEGTLFRQIQVRHPRQTDWRRRHDLPMVVVAVVDNEEIEKFLTTKGCIHFADYILYGDINDWLYDEPMIRKAILGISQINEAVDRADCDAELFELFSKALGNIEDRCRNKLASEEIDLLYKSILILAVRLMHEERYKKLLGEAFLKEIGLSKYVLLLIELFSYDVVTAADLMPRKEKASCRTNPHVIGVYYHRLFSGGTERVVSKLIPILKAKDYKIVLFSDEIDESREYSLPEGLVRVCLGKETAGRQRFELLQKSIEEHGIEVYCCHMYVGYALYDLFFVNQLGVPVVLEYHQNFIINAFDGNFPLSMAICRFTDVLVTLSDMDAMFWRLLGCRSLCIPNPVEKPEIEECEPEPNTILWIQRIVPFQKQCFDLPEILSYVTAVLPEVKLQIVGMPDDPRVEEKLKGMFEARGLLGHVDFLGYHREVGNFYRKAAVLLITSAFEGFPMVIAESKKYGTPLVMYELPYLELLRDGKGFIAVPQNDKYAAAKELVRVLKNPSLRKNLSREAKKSLADFTKLDIGAKWQEAFGLAMTGHETRLSGQERQFAEIERLMVKTYEKVRLAEQGVL